MKILFGFWTVLAALAMSSAQAATFCVNKNDTSGACSTTIGAAVTLASNDALDPDEVHTIAIKAATYFESVTVPNDPELVGLIIKGSGKTIIDPITFGTPGLTIDAPEVVVSGLVVNNANSDGIRVNGNGDRITLSKISVNNTDSDCIELNGGVDDAILTGNKFFSCDGNGIRVTGNKAAISKNKFTHVGNAAVSLTGDEHVVESNSCVLVGSCVTAAAGSDKIVVRKNKTVEHESDNISVDGADALIEGNTAVAGDDADLLDVEGANPQVLSNKSKNVGSGINVTCTASCTDVIVERNSVTSASGSDCFFLSFATAGAEVTGNTAKNCAGNGFEVEGGGDVLLESNKVTAGGSDNDDGFVISGGGVKSLLKNSATFFGGNGFAVFGTGSPVAHALEGNKSSKHGRDGFLLDSDTNGVTMTGNTATGNIQEGFDNRGVNNAFSENKASGNREGSDFCSTGAFVDNGDNNFKTNSSPNCVDF